MDGWMDGRTDGRTDGRIEGVMDGWMDRWIDRLDRYLFQMQPSNGWNDTMYNNTKQYETYNTSVQQSDTLN